MNKKILNRTIIIVGLLFCLGSNNIKANVLDYSDIYSKEINTTKTLSSDYFSDSIYYSDKDGYSGYYYKYGSSTVISGKAPISKYVEITVTNDTDSFSNTYSYDGGGYSGSLRKSGNPIIESISKNVSGSASIQEGFTRTCLRGGTLTKNPAYDATKFNYNDMKTWYACENGESWADEKSSGFGNSSVSSGFSVWWNNNTMTSESYNSGGYTGNVSYSYNGYSDSTADYYKANPNNGYKASYTGQVSTTRTRTYKYSLSGTVYKNTYKQTYSGYVYTEDTRVWEQEYRGTAYKKI